MFTIAVFYFASQYRENEFYLRLKDKARTTARLLIEIDEVDADLLKIIDRNNLTSLPKEQIVVYNYLNQIIYDSDDNPHDNPASQDLLNQIRVQGEVRFHEGIQEAIGIVVNHQYERYVVIATALDQFGLSKLRNLRIVLASGLIVSLAVVAFAGWVFAGRAISPVADMVGQASKITHSNLNLRVREGNGKDELAQLAVTFNQMLDRLQEAFEIQRSFVANASHELRTPLTILTGQIEVTLIKRRSVEEYEEHLRTMLADITNLNKLSNDLLDLAQVSGNIGNLRLQKVQVDELIYQAALTLSSKQPNYNTSFEFEEKAPEVEQEFIVWGDEALLKTAFLNLMENACKFSSNHLVKVVLGIEGGFLRIQFSDEGIGISETELVHIFEPFFRAANAKSVKGHGIGLSLTQKIIELHHGKIIVSSLLNKGTTFTVLLPLIF